MKLLTQQEFIKKCQNIHGDLYDYSNTFYTKSTEYITIICKIHGEFIQQAKTHLRGQGCKFCANDRTSKRHKKSLDVFLNEIKNIHDNFYSYEKFIYNGAHYKSYITCPFHGDFLQDAHSHLKGHGCPKCAKINSDKWGWSKSKWITIAKNKYPKLYIVRLFNEQEDFIKVGITSKLKSKYRLIQIPYNYEILLEIEESPEYIWNLENLIKNTFKKECRYIPNKSFKGMYECYKKQNLNKILELCKKSV